MSTMGDLALPIVRARLSRLAGDTSLDTQFLPILAAAERELEKESGTLIADDADDLMLLVDVSVWNYQRRDKPGPQPEWLHYKRKQRILRIRGVT